MTPSIIVIEPSSSGLKLLPKVKEMNRRLVVLTAGHGDRTIPSGLLDHADRVELVDTNDDRAVLARARLVASENRVSAVLSGFEYYVPVAADVAAALGLAGIAPEAARALRYKDRMRVALERAGVRVPWYHTITSRGELAAVTEEALFPYVVKPSDASGSLNVVKVHDANELYAAYDAIASDPVIDMGRPLGERVLVEEYIDGPEYSVEGYVFGGSIRFVSITEKLLGEEPYFVEAGHIVSAAVGPDTEASIWAYVTQVIEALNLGVGPFHAELRVSSKGPVLVEIGARLAGDHICELIKSGLGVDMFEAMIRCYEGVDPAVRLPSVRRFAGIRFFIRPQLRRFSRVSGWDELRSLNGFESGELLIQPGTAIPRATSFLGRLGYAIFTRDTYDELWASLARADRVIAFHS